VVTKHYCMGLKQIDRHFPSPKILLKFEVKGISRWPFGWEILRALESSPHNMATQPAR
jgi:hypothetical protein